MIKDKIHWEKQINKFKKLPSIFLANEFFDALAIKQFQKDKIYGLKNSWDLKIKKYFFLKKIDIKN